MSRLTLVTRQKMVVEGGRSRVPPSGYIRDGGLFSGHIFLGHQNGAFNLVEDIKMMKSVLVCLTALVYVAAAMPPPGAASGTPPPAHPAAAAAAPAAPFAPPFSMFSAFIPTAKEIADLQALNTTPVPGIIPAAAMAGLPAATAIGGLPVAAAPGGLPAAAAPGGLPAAAAPGGLPAATASPLFPPTMPPAVAKLVAKYQAAAAAFSPTVPAPV